MSATGLPNVRSGARIFSPSSMPPLWQTKTAMIGLPWISAGSQGAGGAMRITTTQVVSRGVVAVNVR